MIKVQLKDGSILEVEQGSSILEVAKKISEGLARVATCGEVDGKIKDLRYKLDEDCNLVIHTFESSKEGKKAYWHTTSHIMAQAVKRLFPNVKFAIGPSIDEGFYYDFDVENPFTDEDKKNIEEEMKKIIKEDIEIKRFSLPKEEALKLMEGQIYKQELISELSEGEEISFYEQGDFVDLCAGPHLTSTGKVKAVKILSSSGAYWRGNEKNKMLQRIYGISFPKASQLEEHLKLLEEAKQRDHRKIGKELEIFMTHELVGSGLPMYLPDGATIRRLLERYILDKEVKQKYKHVYTPSLANVQLYKTSGHWDHYKEDMFPVMQMENEELVLRPMNCPHHMLIYKHKLHSYRDLPIRIGELAHDFRYEASGNVCGLERVRQMCQNDAHIFVRPDQIKEEFGKVVNLILDVYKDFGFTDYSFRLSLRDKEDKEKYYDDDEMWENAESQLREILTQSNLNFYEAKGEAAFYGPKLDVQIKTAVGHDITISTCQLDFLLPQKFELEYIGEDGKAHRPVVIHRAILGSFDRFIAFLLEETKGALPTWLAPVQVNVMPITDNFKEYAKQVADKLEEKDIRVEFDDRNEKIGYKIREAQLKKVPYMLIIGEKEQDSNSVGVRSREKGDIGAMKIEEFIEKILKEVQNHEK
ncbi:MAG TPA: threonine--tRNA ligase [Clostridiaceae bacterium]|nr:threonine--tRNA ligase [Clostridiaceae bacterium]